MAAKRKYTIWKAAGRATTGAITVDTGTNDTPRIGDRVNAVVNTTQAYDVTGQFESRITVAGQIQQSGTTNVTTSDCLVIFATRK